MFGLDAYRPLKSHLNNIFPIVLLTDERTDKKNYRVVALQKKIIVTLQSCLYAMEGM